MLSRRTWLVLLYLCSVEPCRNEQNEKVDWFVMYKLPEEKKHVNPLIQNGVAYTYITSKDALLQWKLSKTSIADPKSIPGLTLSSLYSNNTQMHILYNDKPPLKVYFDSNHELGHTKGVLAIDNSIGYWLIHSVPHFPELNTHNYPSSAILYGQSFLCLSLNTTNLNAVAKQLQYNQPNIYTSFIDTKCKQKLPEVLKIINKEYINTPPWYNLQEIHTLQGKTFLSFAKSRNFGKDLYVDWVAAELQANLNVESWLHGPGRLASDCSKKYSVNNVIQIKLSVANITFTSEKDHSKWAVTTNKAKPWTCIGDINRAEHQKHRGGGTVCTNIYPQLWTDYYTVINKTEPCNKKKTTFSIFK